VSRRFSDSDVLINDPRPHHRNAFRTYASYARAWRIVATRDDAPQPEADEVVDRDFKVAHLAGILREEIPSSAGIDFHKPSITDDVHRAWSTEWLMQETLARIRPFDAQMHSSAAPWVVVQAYYAVFSMTQALTRVLLGSRSFQHAEVRRQFHDAWRVDRLECPPWSSAIIAAPGDDLEAYRLECVPEGVDPRRTHAWTEWSRFDAWDVATMSLRTTLERELQARYAKRRSELRRADGTKGVRSLSRQKKESVRAKMHPVTLLDFLHRLRVRANYEDAVVYERGWESLGASDVREFMVDLTRITSATLLASEMRLSSVSPPGLVPDLARKWLRFRDDPTGAPVAGRLDVMDAVTYDGSWRQPHDATQSRSALQ
jgi:hypothetical protein